jgi:hypothetical protein
MGALGGILVYAELEEYDPAGHVNPVTGKAVPEK